MYGVDGRRLSIQYKERISGFHQWEYKHTANEYVLYPENIGPYLSIDETCLSQDEVYTIVTNKAAKGKRGSLVAIVKGTDSHTVIPILKKISAGKRIQVKEITLDLSPAMKLICKKVFPGAIQVSDRFHVQQLFTEALDDLRIKHRWDAMDKENQRIKECRSKKEHYYPYVFENGDTRKQLLFRSKRLLMMHKGKWTATQQQRANILFRLYPDIEEAYSRYMDLVNFYNDKTMPRALRMTKLAHWYDKIEKMQSRCFTIVLDTFQNNYPTILNYFDHRSTNASAESFNAKVKAFRSQFRGVSDIPFFIFRLTKLFA